jgi:hypothetical protein
MVPHRRELADLLEALFRGFDNGGSLQYFAAAKIHARAQRILAWSGAQF